MSFKLGRFGQTGTSFYNHSNSFLNIAYGAVRSGKTITCTMRFLKHIFTNPNDRFLLCGKSRDTIKRNIMLDLTSILDMLGVTYTYSYINGELKFNGNIIFIVGLNDEKATDKLKGLTVAGALVDEVTTVPRSSFEMLLTRCSLTGSKIFCTTNPDSPYHWLYADYINNENIGEDYVRSWKFNIEDNPHLKKEYIDTQKKLNSKSSAHYKRYILGEWAMAEGRIYEHFNTDNILNFDDLPDNFDRIDVGCDYGVSAPNCFILIGTVFNKTGNYFYCIDELYHDPEVKGYSQTDSEKIEDVIQLLNNWNIPDKAGYVYFPHDATSLKKEAYHHELGMYTGTFKPDVLECIGVIQDLTFNNHLLVCENCTELIKQFDTYSWDLKKQIKGVDYPLMVNDHAVDAIRAPIIERRKFNPEPISEYIDLWGTNNSPYLF